MRRLLWSILLIPLFIGSVAGQEETNLAPLLQTLTNGRDTTARIKAARSLGRSGNKLAITPLITVLGDANRAVRWAAIEALGELEDRTAVPVLLEYFERKEAYRWGNILTVNALTAIGDSRARDAFESYLEISTDPILQRSMIIALSELGNTATIPVILPFLNDEREWLQMTAHNALVRLAEQWLQGDVPQGYQEWQQWYYRQDKQETPNS